MDSNQFSVGVFEDLSKAFDTFDHTILFIVISLRCSSSSSSCRLVVDLYNASRSASNVFVESLMIVLNLIFQSLSIFTF